MKHKFFAAPLLSLTLLILFFQPLKNGELIKKPKSLIELQLPISVMAAQPAPVYSSAGVSLLGEITREPADLFTQSLTASTALREFGLAGARLEDLAPDLLVDLDPDLQNFIAEVTQGGPGTDLRGVYIQDVLSLKVEQQPEDKATYVSTEPGTVTQFESAARYGVTGLLAHNYLSGKLFYGISPGQEVNLIYEDGSIKRYRVSDIQSFQKLKFSTGSTPGATTSPSRPASRVKGSRTGD
jgi:hypothetical protein